MSEPSATPEAGLEEAEWQQLVQRASGAGRSFFTANQLYMAYARHRVQVTRYVARRGVWGLALIVLGLSTWVYSLKGDWGLTLVLGIVVTLSGVAMVGTGVVTRRDPASRVPLTRWLSGSPPGLERLLSATTLAYADLSYAPQQVDCVVLVERDELADLLLKNAAQHALSALIVAESGYPQALGAEAKRVLTERTDLQVIALHDATPAGVGMVGRLRKSSTLPLSDRPLLDAGIFPADVTWLAELAPAIPAGHTNNVPLDSLSLEALLVGIRGVKRGALSLQRALQDAAEAADADSGLGLAPVPHGSSQ